MVAGPALNFPAGYDFPIAVRDSQKTARALSNSPAHCPGCPRPCGPLRVSTFPQASGLFGRLDLFTKKSMMNIRYSIGAVFGLAVAILMMGCTASNEMIEQQHDAEVDSLNATITDLHDELSLVRDSLRFLSDIDSGQYYRDRRVLQDEIQRLEYSLAVCRDGGRTIQTLAVDQIFEPASANLTDSGRSQLDVLAETLLSGYSEDVIRIEAHSDSSPVGPRLAETYPSNWELSAARAAAVVRYVIDEHDFPTGQLEVTSYGSTRPIAQNDSAAGREKNRRLRIAVVER